MLWRKEKGSFSFKSTPAERREEVLKSMTTEERGVADWVVKNNKRAGATTNTLSHAQNLYLAVRGLQGVMGVMGIPSKYYPAPEVFEKNLTDRHLKRVRADPGKKAAAGGKAGHRNGDPAGAAALQSAAGDFP